MTISQVREYLTLDVRLRRWPISQSLQSQPYKHICIENKYHSSKSHLLQRFNDAVLEAGRDGSGGLCPKLKFVKGEESSVDGEVRRSGY